jgi:hypothetical protein
MSIERHRLTTTTTAGLICFLCLVLLIPGSGLAQSDNARLSGFVRDTTGGVIPGARVAARNETTGFERSAITSDEGYYIISALPPGSYTVMAEMVGFKRFEATGKKLDSNMAATFDVLMQIGEIAEIVSVEASTAAVQKDTATLGRLIEGKQIELTQLNGRNPLFLALLKPGVTGSNMIGNSYSMTTGNFNINGSRSQDNMIFFDGAVGIRTRSNTTWSIGVADLDTTHEVQILAANYSAEYGRSAGGQIRIVTKSGGRDFHGSFYEYFRNAALNANTWSRNQTGSPDRPCDQFPTDAACRPSPFRYNQFGYTLSGPVLLPWTSFNQERNKVFWLFGQEYVRVRTSTLRTLTVPTEKMRQGDFSELLGPNRFFSTPRYLRDPLKPGVCNASDQSGCFSDGGIVNKIPIDRLSPNGMAILRAFPEPIPGYLGPGSANWFADRANYDNQVKSTLSVDLYPSVRHQIRWRSQLFKRDLFTAFPFSNDPGYVPRGFVLPNQRTSINWVWSISTNWINEALVTGSKDRVSIPIDVTNARRSTYGINYPYLFPQGKEIDDKIPSVEGLFSRLDGSPYPASSAGPIYQFSDQMTMIRGSHMLKFGALLERSGQNDFDQINVAGVPGGTNNQNGAFAFSNTTPGGTGLAIGNAAMGLFDTYAEIGSRSYTPYRGHMVEWFVNDSWKATPKLVVESGLRHSIIQPQYSLWGNIVVFDPRFYDPSIAATVDPQTGLIIGGDLKARFNGLVIPGNGWPEAAKGRVSIAETGEFDFLFRGTGKSYSKVHKNNLQPRLGIAYAFNDKTALRAGVGRFFSRLGPSDSVFLGGNPPLQAAASVSRGSVDNPGGTGGTAFPLLVTSQDPLFPNPEAWNWNVTLQREIGFSTVVEASYVGRRGLHAQRERNINAVAPGTVQANPGVHIDYLRPYKGFSTIRVTNNDASSRYNSLQLGVNRRFSQGLAFGVAYTLSKSMDDGSAQRDILSNPFDASTWWGPSSFDRRHVAVINGIYQLPFFKNRSSLTGKLLGGWTLSGVSQLQTGSPFSVWTSDDFAGVGAGNGPQFWYINGDPSLPRSQRGFSTGGSDDYWFTVKNPDGSPIFVAPDAGTFSTQNVRNFLYNPGFQGHNLGIFKDFAIGEGHSLQVRFEAFNWLNHPNLGGANSNPRSASFGKVTSKSNERDLQLALRYSF